MGFLDVFPPFTGFGFDVFPEFLSPLGGEIEEPVVPDPTRMLITESQWDGETRDATGAIITVALTASDENVGGDFAGVNLQRHGTKNEWATLTATGTKTIKWHSSAAQLVSFFLLAKHNGTSAGTFRLRLATSEANLTAAPVYDSGALSLWAVADMYELARRSCFVSFPAVSASWAQLDISDATNPDGRFIAARAILANALQTDLFPLVGSDFLTGEDYSIITKGPLGFDSAVVQEPRMDFGKEWACHAKTEAERVGRIWRRCGLTRDIAAVANPTAATLADLNLGVFRWRSKPRIRWNARTSEEQGHWSMKLDLAQVG